MRAESENAKILELTDVELEVVAGGNVTDFIADIAYAVVKTVSNVVEGIESGGGRSSCGFGRLPC